MSELGKEPLERSGTPWPTLDVLDSLRFQPTGYQCVKIFISSSTNFSNSCFYLSQTPTTKNPKPKTITNSHQLLENPNTDNMNFADANNNPIDIAKQNAILREKLAVSERKNEKTDQTNRELAGQLEDAQHKQRMLEAEVEEGKSDSQLYFDALHTPITLSCFDDHSQIAKAAEKRSKFVSRVLGKVTVSRNEMIEVVDKMNRMLMRVGFGSVDIRKLMGPEEGIEGGAFFIDLQSGGAVRSMSEDWNEIAERFLRFCVGDKELTRNVFMKKAAKTAEIGTQTAKKADTPREARQKRWNARKNAKKILMKK